jgi:hypothetical protein
MRWMMIAFLVSLGALLLAVAGVARHIRLHRNRLDSNPRAGDGPAHLATSNEELDAVEEVDHEVQDH